MRKNFLFLMGVMVLMGACDPPNATVQTPEQVTVHADPVTVESSDGNRYHCEAILSLTYGAYYVRTLIDCHRTNGVETPK